MKWDLIFQKETHTEKAKKRNCLCISHKSKSHIRKFWPFLKSNLCTRSEEKKTSKYAWVCVCNKVSSFFVCLSLFLFLYWLIKHYIFQVLVATTHTFYEWNIFIWCDQLIDEWGKNVRRRAASRRTIRQHDKKLLARKIWLTKNVVCRAIRRNNIALSVRQRWIIE